MKKKTVFSIILVVLFLGCSGSDTKTKPKKIESRTGLETDAATSQEVDTLNKKIDQMMEGVE